MEEAKLVPRRHQIKQLENKTNSRSMLRTTIQQQHSNTTMEQLSGTATGASNNFAQEQQQTSDREQQHRATT
jgi:hypothetical protein